VLLEGWHTRALSGKIVSLTDVKQEPVENVKKNIPDVPLQQQQPWDA